MCSFSAVGAPVVVIFSLRLHPCTIEWALLLVFRVKVCLLEAMSRCILPMNGLVVILSIITGPIVPAILVISLVFGRSPISIALVLLLVVLLSLLVAVARLSHVLRHWRHRTRLIALALILRSIWGLAACVIMIHFCRTNLIYIFNEKVEYSTDN